MLHKIGTSAELQKLVGDIPTEVYAEVHRHVAILDKVYGAHRDCTTYGGYIVIVENEHDMQDFKAIVDYELHACEWAAYVSESTVYISALYVMNDDFTIELFVPADIAPSVILDELDIK